MANEPEYPFTTFNFRIAIQVAGPRKLPLCAAEFAECDGMELSLEPKTIREGGNNARPIHLVGPTSYGQLTLKRGMTSDFGLWEWFEAVHAPGGSGVRGSGEIAIMPEDPTAKTPRIAFRLTGCLPIKLKMPALNAREGGIAVEELQVAYESLTRVTTGAGGTP
jgi:phage tail-like protein